MFRNHPEPVRTACVGLIVGGFVFLIFAGMGFYLMASEPMDSLGKGMTAGLALISVFGVTAGFWLASRGPGALPLAWVSALSFCIVFPLGAIVGVIVMQGLASKEMSRFLNPSSPSKRKRSPSRKRKQSSTRSRSDW